MKYLNVILWLDDHIPEIAGALVLFSLVAVVGSCS